MSTKVRSHDIDCSVEPSLTVQAHRDECDINRIMAKYRRTGSIDFSRDVESRRYVDLASAPSFHAAMNIVAAASEAFEALPSKIRSEFGNDPAKFLAFVHDPANQARAVDIGLSSKPASIPDPFKPLADAVSRSLDAALGRSTPTSGPVKDPVS